MQPLREKLGKETPLDLLLFTDFLGCRHQIGSCKNSLLQKHQGNFIQSLFFWQNIGIIFNFSILAVFSPYRQIQKQLCDIYLAVCYWRLRALLIAVVALKQHQPSISVSPQIHQLFLQVLTLVNKVMKEVRDDIKHG